MTYKDQVMAARQQQAVGAAGARHRDDRGRRKGRGQVAWSTGPSSSEGCRDRSRSAGRYNTFSGHHRSSSHGRGGRDQFRERTRSCPPQRRQRSKSEDSSMYRRRMSSISWQEPRTSLDTRLPERSFSRARAMSAGPGSRSKYDVDRHSKYYSRRAQSFIDRRYLPS